MLFYTLRNIVFIKLRVCFPKVFKLPLWCQKSRQRLYYTTSSFPVQATKRKHVVKEVLGDFVAPTESQQIVKIVGSRGNNLHEVLTSSGDTFLVSMPTKFRKNIWIKRGDFVIVDPIEEGEKVKAEISSILYKDHIQHLKKQQQWPEGFMEELPVQDRTTNQQQEEEERPEEEEEEEEDSGNSDDDDSDLFVNTNRCNYQYESEEEEDDSEEEDDK